MSCWLRRLQQLHYYQSRFINNKSFPKGNLGVVDVQYNISEADPCLICFTWHFKIHTPKVWRKKTLIALNVCLCLEIEFCVVTKRLLVASERERSELARSDQCPCSSLHFAFLLLPRPKAVAPRTMRTDHLLSLV